MMKTNKILCLAIAMLTVLTASAKQKATDNMLVVAYVTSWTNEVPDPMTMTHINYAFGHVSDSFDGVRVDNPDRLRMIVGLKSKNPSLKVMLSIGGWGASEDGAADASARWQPRKRTARLL